MQMRWIGSLEVSIVGLGTNNFGTDFFGPGCDLETTRSIVDAALESGVNFFDTAEEYSVPSQWGTGQSEQFLGAALGSRREQVIVASKFQPENLAKPEQRGAERIREAIDATLRRLGTDYVDLYQQHRPDPDTPIEETLGTLDELVQAGKVREIGCSNFTGPGLDEASAAAATAGGARYRSVQNRYSLLEATPEASEGGEEADDWLDSCERNDLQVIPHSPLANGLLTGKYSGALGEAAGGRLASDAWVSKMLAEGDLSEGSLAAARALEAYARAHGHSLLELAFSWLASQPRVATVIAGATKPEQVRANVASVGWALGAAEFAEVARLAAARAA